MKAAGAPAAFLICPRWRRPALRAVNVARQARTGCPRTQTATAENVPGRRCAISWYSITSFSLERSIRWNTIISTNDIHGFGRRQENDMKLEVRKLVTYVEDTFIEGGKAAARPLKLFGAAAVLRNPWAGRGFVEDLKPEIHALAPQLGEMLTAEVLRVAGSGDAVEGYGKAAIVGT